MDAFNKDREDNTKFSYVLLDRKCSFVFWFTNFCVEFSRGQINEVSPALLDITTFLASSNIFIDVPTCITHLFVNKMV